MILEEDSLLNFRYDPKTDILSVRFPDLIDTPIPQIENSLEKLGRNIINFDVKKLLLDLRSGVIGIGEEDYRFHVGQFLKTLGGSRLEKVARVIPENPVREYLIDHFAAEMRTKLGLPFEAQSFTSKTEALRWLKNPAIII